MFFHIISVSIRQKLIAVYKFEILAKSAQMSIPPEISKQNLEVFPRAHAQKFSGARQQDDKEKIYHQSLLLRPKATIVIFFTFVVFCCYLLPQQKNVAKMLPNTKQTFFVKKIFLKKCFQCL